MVGQQVDLNAPQLDTCHVPDSIAAVSSWKAALSQLGISMTAVPLVIVC